MGKHRGPRGPEVVRHRRVMPRGERAALLVALTILLAFMGLLGWLILTIPRLDSATTP